MELQSYTRVVTFKMDPHMLERVDRIAKELSMSRSELIRAALEEFLLKFGTFLKDNNKENEGRNRSLLEAEVILI